MNRFKRIAHHGWLGKALSVLTFGYFPYADEVAALVGTYGTIFGVCGSGQVASFGAVATIQEDGYIGFISSVSAAGSISGASDSGVIRRA